MKYRWQPRSEDNCKDKTHSIPGISEITSTVLANRGINTQEAASLFFSPGISLMHSPLLFRDMKKASARVLRALDKKEKIMLCTDYDVDGCTSAAILYRALIECGMQEDGIILYQPSRTDEGYGFPRRAVDEAHASGASLIITADLGISEAGTAEYSGNKGIDLIITDHHLPPAELPKALAIIDPHIEDCGYPFNGLSGAGTAFKLASAFCLEKYGSHPKFFNELIQLAALGTVCDMMPMTGENRIITKAGFSIKRDSGFYNPGVAELQQISGNSNNSLDVFTAGFQIGPRINALSRIEGDPAEATELLTSRDPVRIRKIASRLEGINKKRRFIEQEYYRKAEKYLKDNPAAAEKKIIILAGKKWEKGICGLVAGRLSSRYYRPAVVLSDDGETMTASCRSIPGFDIHEALLNSSDLFVKFGGHKQAAGFEIKTGKYEKLKEALYGYTESRLTPEQMVPLVIYDMNVRIADITRNVVEELLMLEPTGEKNPPPLFVCEGRLKDRFIMGRNRNHLKFILEDDSGTAECTAFGLAERAEELAYGAVVRSAFTPVINEYMGAKTVQFNTRVFEVVGP
ncbi:MAG: single-stranded-DNA-specific exonuclease RecJ [Fibrobacterota bacterium]